MESGVSTLLIVLEWCPLSLSHLLYNNNNQQQLGSSSHHNVRMLGQNQGQHQGHSNSSSSMMSWLRSGGRSGGGGRYGSNVDSDDPNSMMAVQMDPKLFMVKNRYS
jgi:hypothetical protein